MPDDLAAPEALTAAIIGFEIQVTDLKEKFKLSQHRNTADLQGVIAGLSSRGDKCSRGILELMAPK